MHMRGSEEVYNADLMANDIVAQLQENLGMNVNIQVWPGETWASELFKNEFQLVWIRWWYDYPVSEQRLRRHVLQPEGLRQAPGLVERRVR